MDQNRVFIIRALHKLLPSSIIGDIACFVFYDHHPRDERNLDVTVCTNSGEVLEYYQHELISSFLIESVGHVNEIKILRNSKCKLFYLVVARDDLVILSKNTEGNLQVHNRISNVRSYSVDDLECTGLARLTIVHSDCDAVPLVFDDNFIKLTLKNLELNNANSENSVPIVNQLMRKLVEAKYTTKHNETKYKDYVNMRQAAAFSLYKEATFDSVKPITKLSPNMVSNLLGVTAKPPVVKMCNKKVVIIIDLTNNNNVSIKNICVLLHSDSKQSIEYSTKVFQNIPKEPHWKESEAQIKSCNNSTVVSVIDLKEIQFDEASRIEFEISISFTKIGKIHLLPTEGVSISPLDVMGDNFDVLVHGGDDFQHLLLCILSTSECFDLHLRHILNSNENVTLCDIFYTYLKMEKCLDNVAIHKVSPFHKLYGVMVVFGDIEDTSLMCVKVYTRFSSQALALMHYIYDVVPFRIIATTSDYQLSQISNDNLSNYNETSQGNKEINYRGCAESILKQLELINEYIDECTRKMSEDSLLDKVGVEVDLMASGVPKYLEFRKKILAENLEGIKSISFDESPSSDDADCMIIDN